MNTKSVVLALAVLAMATMQLASADIVNNHYDFADCAAAQAAGQGGAGEYVLRAAKTVQVPCSTLNARFVAQTNATVDCSAFTSCGTCANEPSGECSWCTGDEVCAQNDGSFTCDSTFVAEEANCPEPMCDLALDEVRVYCDADGFQLATKFVQRIALSELSAGEADDIEADYYSAESNYYDDGAENVPLNMNADWDAADGFTIESHSWLELLHGGNGLQDGSFYQIKVAVHKYTPPATNATTAGTISDEAETTITFEYDETAALTGESLNVNYVTVGTAYTAGQFVVAYPDGGRVLVLPSTENGFGFATDVEGKSTDYFFPRFGQFTSGDDVVGGAGSYGESGDAIFLAVSIRAIQCNNDGSADAGETAACPDVAVCVANGVCEAVDNGEDCASCPADCGACGNDICERFEYCYYDAETNTTDANGVGPTANPDYSSACDDDEAGRCKGVCGDGYTDGVGEDAEGCRSCAADYGECPIVCGDGICADTDDAETCESCPDDCGACEGEDPLQGSVDLSASGGLEVLATQKKGDLLAVSGRFWGVLAGDAKRVAQDTEHGSPWYAIVDTGANEATVQGMVGVGAATAVAFAPGSDDSLQVGIAYDVLGGNEMPADARGPGAAFIETDDALDLDAAVFADLSTIAGEEWDSFDTKVIGVSNIGDHDTYALVLTERVPPAVNCSVWTDDESHAFDGDDCDNKAELCAAIDTPVGECYLCGYPGTVLPAGVNCTAQYAVAGQQAMASRQAPPKAGGSVGESKLVFANVDFDAETASYSSVSTPAGEQTLVSGYGDYAPLRLLTGVTTRSAALDFDTWTYDVVAGDQIPCPCIFEPVPDVEQTVECPTSTNSTGSNNATRSVAELDDMQDLYEDEIFEREDGTCYILVEQPDECSGFGSGGCTACNLNSDASPIAGLDPCPREGAVYTQVNNGTVSVEHTATAGPTGFVVVFGKDGRALAALTYTNNGEYEVVNVDASAEGDTVTASVTRQKTTTASPAKRQAEVTVETQITIQAATGAFAAGDAGALEGAITQADPIVLPTTSGVVTVVDSAEDAGKTVVVGEFTETLSFNDADGNIAYSFTSSSDGDNQAGYLVVYDADGVATFAEAISADGGDVTINGVSVVGANSYSVAGSFTGDLTRPTAIAGHPTESRTFIVTLGAVPAKAPEAIDELTFDYDASGIADWVATAETQFAPAGDSGYGVLAFTPAPFTRVQWEEPITNGAAVTSYDLQSETFRVPEFPNVDVFGSLLEGGAGTANGNDAETGKPLYYYDHALLEGDSGAALSPATDYTYRIRSSSAAGTSVWSAETDATTRTVPNAPINVLEMSDDADFDRVRISWAPPTVVDPHAPIKGYLARVNDGEGGAVDGASVEVFAANARFGYITGHGLALGELIANTTYTIHLSAFNWYGEGPAVELTASTLPPLPPTVPKRPFLEAATTDSLTVRWETVPDTGVAVTYTVQKAVQNDAFADWRSVTHDATQPAAACQNTDDAHSYENEDGETVLIDLCEQVDTGLEARTFYRYRVGASNVEGFSGYGPFNRFRTATASAETIPVDATDDDNDKPAKTVIGITVGVGVAAVLVALFIHNTGERKYNNFFFLLIGVAAVALAVLIAWLVELLG